MKKITLLLLISIMSANSLMVKADDAQVVANWVFPIFWGFPWTAAPAPQTQKLATASPAPVNFDAANCNFDVVWSSIQSEYSIGNAVNNSQSAKGGDDFAGGFKALYDDDNLYIMLQYTDDDVTGEEVTEIMWAPYTKIQALEEGTFKDMAATNAIQYCRYEAFGAYKVAFSNVAYKSAMTISFNDHGANTLNFDGTNTLLDANISMKSYTAIGSKTIKVIYTLGFGVFTGQARPEFNTSIWSSINDGKGLSFDVKVTDNDADDVKDAQNSPQPCAYWWNSTHNDGYAITNYSGFLGLPVTSVDVRKSDASIFNHVQKNIITLSKPVDISILSITGKTIFSQNQTNTIDLSKLASGVYFVRAGTEVIKISR